MTATATELKIRPAGDQLLVVRDAAPEETPGGILLPESSRPRTNRGTVVAAGIGRLGDNGIRTPMEFRAGDRVIFTDFAGQAIEHDGEEYIIMSQSEVLASVID